MHWLPPAPLNTVDFLRRVLPPCLDSCTFQRLQLHCGSARSCPLGVIIAQVVTWKTVKVGFVILYEGVFGPPRAVCLWIHLSAPNQILLDRCLSPFRPTDILHSVCLQGVQDKVKGLRFFYLVLFFFYQSHPPTPPTPTIHCPNPPPPLTQDQPGSPSPTQSLTLNLKPFIILFFFLFSTMQSWTHFALLFLCVNMWMMICYKIVKYVKDHSLFWKNLHLSFWR